MAKWSHPNARRKETLVELRRIALRSRDYRRAPPPPKGHLTTNGSGHGTESIIATNFTLQIYIDSGIRGVGGNESNQVELYRQIEMKPRRGEGLPDLRFRRKGATTVCFDGAVKIRGWMNGAIGNPSEHYRAVSSPLPSPELKVPCRYSNFFSLSLHLSLPAIRIRCRTYSSILPDPPSVLRPP